MKRRTRVGEIRQVLEWGRRRKCGRWEVGELFHTFTFPPSSLLSLHHNPFLSVNPSKRMQAPPTSTFSPAPSATKNSPPSPVPCFNMGGWLQTCRRSIVDNGFDGGSCTPQPPTLTKPFKSLPWTVLGREVSFFAVFHGGTAGGRVLCPCSVCFNSDPSNP